MYAKIPGISSDAQERFARKNEGLELKRAFDFLDKNGDGKVDAEELRAYFAAMGHKTKKARRLPTRRPMLCPVLTPYPFPSNHFASHRQRCRT